MWARVNIALKFTSNTDLLQKHSKKPSVLFRPHVNDKPPSFSRISTFLFLVPDKAVYVGNEG